jgi:putative tryptophan/tyrosine transport system substrate-binding protein
MVDMRRRELLTLIGGVAAWPVVARAQRERMRRIGILMTFAADDLEGRARVTAFMQALQQLGWADGRNVRIDARWGLNDGDLGKFAAELVELAPDVILTSSSVAVASMLQATRTIPIVFTIVIDLAIGGSPKAAVVKST